MKGIIIICLLFVNTIYSQICTASTGDCAGCISTSKCQYCYSDELCISNTASCATGNGTTICDGNFPDISAGATFKCYYSNSSGATVVGGYATNVNAGITSSTVQAISYAAVSTLGKPALFGFQYNNIEIDGTTFTSNSLAAYFTLVNAFEFIPTAASGAFTSTDQIIGNVLNFTNTTLGPCTNSTKNGTTYNYISLNYGNGWQSNCRFASQPVTDPTTGIKISPVNTKCDITFGTFPYSGLASTRLGLTIAFVTASSSVDVSTNSGTAITTCKAGNSICLVVGGSNAAAIFTWAKFTSNTSDIASTGIMAYEGNSTDFYLPSNAASGDISALVSSSLVNVQKFAAANVVVFSFTDPVSGDIWDPQLSETDASTISSQISASSMITHNLGLIAIALLVIFKII